MGKNLNKRLTKVASALRSPHSLLRTRLGRTGASGFAGAKWESFFRTHALRMISLNG